MLMDASRESPRPDDSADPAPPGGSSVSPAEEPSMEELIAQADALADELQSQLGSEPSWVNCT